MQSLNKVSQGMARWAPALYEKRNILVQTVSFFFMLEVWYTLEIDIDTDTVSMVLDDV